MANITETHNIYFLDIAFKKEISWTMDVMIIKGGRVWTNLVAIKSLIFWSMWIDKNEKPDGKECILKHSNNWFLSMIKQMYVMKPLSEIPYVKGVR